MQNDFWAEIDFSAIANNTPLKLVDRQWTMGGITCSHVAERYGTPIFILDATTIRQNCTSIKEAFATHTGHVSVCYAVKAEGNPSILQIILQQGFGAEVASAEELAIVLQNGFLPAKVVFNGNAKTDNQLRLAIATKIRAVIVDCADELERLNVLAQELNTSVPFAIRANLDLGLNTTWSMASSDSKFGVDFEHVKDLYLYVRTRLTHLMPVGLHCHLGSQVHDEGVYYEAMRQLVELLRMLADEGIRLDFLDIGGGFPIRTLIWSQYTSSSPKSPKREELAAQFDLAVFGQRLCASLNQLLKDNRLSSLDLILEPGRAVVMNSGILLTTVQTSKDRGKISDSKWIAVDAGCHTLPDCWIYDWFFECLPLNVDTYALPVKISNIAGPLCDSGDVIARDRLLPPLKRGDLLAFLQVGGYYAGMMQSTFHLLPRAAVALAIDGECKLIQPREWFASQQNILSDSFRNLVID